MQIKDLFFQVRKGNKSSRRGFEKNLEGGGKIVEILGGNFFSAWGGANSNTFFNAGGWQLARRSNMTRIIPVTACTYMSSSKVHLYHTRPNFSFYIHISFSSLSLFWKVLSLVMGAPKNLPSIEAHF